MPQSAFQYDDILSCSRIFILDNSGTNLCKGFMSDARYLNGDTTAIFDKEAVTLSEQRFLRHKESSIARSDLTSFRTIFVVADTRVVVGGGIFVDYKRDYMFPATT